MLIPVHTPSSISHESSVLYASLVHMYPYTVPMHACAGIHHERTHTSMYYAYWKQVLKLVMNISASYVINTRLLNENILWITRDYFPSI